MTNKIRTATTVFILSLFLFYWSVLAFCMHRHTVDGHLVMHAHPYANPLHQHSANEYVLIHHLNLYNTTPDVVADYSMTVFRQMMSDSWVVVYQKNDSGEQIYFSLRAPPRC
ncbi:MAG: hypothetical protein LBH80_02145 [Prevotellaceae bacterium]|jgi:hypothetical protein|nr:hypothetical protein [Prevotellaceae bacterium]